MSNHEGEKSRFSSRMTNPFRRTHHDVQETDPTKQLFPGEEKFQPPPGPPPGYSKPLQPAEVYQPPPGPPLSATHTSDAQPPEYAPWMSIPDTSQLPPPPSMVYEESPTANATGDSDFQAKKWCQINPLDRPRHLLSAERSRIESQDIDLANPPPTFSGRCHRSATGTWTVQTKPTCQDTILLSQLPLYSALEDNVRLTHHPKTIYFEIKVISMTSPGVSGQEADAGIAIGFVAPPYPHWRLPGWERASLGVHGDDGRKYIHNNLGGQDFTTSFQDGEVVGIGMTFTPSQGPARPNVEVFFTREGERDGGWNLYEERDQDDEGSVQGLEGQNDLLGAIGMFGGVQFETRFRRDQWLYRPQR